MQCDLNPVFRGSVDTIKNNDLKLRTWRYKRAPVSSRPVGEVRSLRARGCPARSSTILDFVERRTEMRIDPSRVGDRCDFALLHAPDRRRGADRVKIIVKAAAARFGDWTSGWGRCILVYEYRDDSGDAQ